MVIVILVIHGSRNRIDTVALAFAAGTLAAAAAAAAFLTILAFNLFVASGGVWRSSPRRLQLSSCSRRCRKKKK